jgi:hypothetical protein
MTRHGGLVRLATKRGIATSPTLSVLRGLGAATRKPVLAPTSLDSEMVADLFRAFELSDGRRASSAQLTLHLLTCYCSAQLKIVRYRPGPIETHSKVYSGSVV